MCLRSQRNSWQSKFQRLVNVFTQFARSLCGEEHIFIICSQLREPFEFRTLRVRHGRSKRRSTSRAQMLDHCSSPKRLVEKWKVTCTRNNYQSALLRVDSSSPWVKFEISKILKIYKFTSDPSGVSGHRKTRLKWGKFTELRFSLKSFEWIRQSEL